MANCNHKAIGVTCNCSIADPCLTSYTITANGLDYQYQAGGSYLPTILLIDPPNANGEGTQGVDVSITLDGACCVGDSNCPLGEVRQAETDFKESLSDQECKKVHLSYQPNTMGPEPTLGRAIDQIFCPANDKIIYTPYTFEVVQKNHHPSSTPPTVGSVSLFESLAALGMTSEAHIHVYPELKIKAEITLKGKKEKEEKSVNNQGQVPLLEYKHLSPDFKEGYDFSQLKSRFLEMFEIKGELTINDGSDIETVYSYSPSGNQKDISEAFQKSKEEIRLLEALSDVTGVVMDGVYAPENKKKDGDVKLIGYEVNLPNIKIAGEGKSIIHENAIAYDKNFTLTATPLIGFKVAVDLIQAAATYFQVGSVVAEVREQAKKLEKDVKAGKTGAYVGAEFEISVQINVNTNIALKAAMGEPVSYDFADAQYAVSINGLANVRGGAKVWIVHGAFKLEGKVTAEAKLALANKADTGELEWVFFHDGIKCEVVVEISGGINNDDEKGSENGRASAIDGDVNLDKKYSKPQEWVWVKPLDQAQSPYRGTLLG
ncbi:hypothetical protein [Vibrio algivorus]|uniref:Uncharacterized protein n=1 Tax=Vibrio algivorus TaxID=1667024 RepID=A0A557NSY8_9VIBR|nr:hypothetical protein [Vibrio algivorus]TVO31536.1 hypothetical protein FOF44_17970 [Vibrio algivorus]